MSIHRNSAGGLRLQVERRLPGECSPLFAGRSLSRSVSLLPICLSISLGNISSKTERTTHSRFPRRHILKPGWERAARVSE